MPIRQQHAGQVYLGVEMLGTSDIDAMPTSP